jgi:Asp-tRNA(Asn)/Glu-tRNA(Gln) amidotransferase A subunit family amidase
MTTDDLCFLDLVEVGRRIQSGRLSSVEVTQAVLARITKLDPHLRSYATLTATWHWPRPIRLMPRSLVAPYAARCTGFQSR